MTGIELTALVGTNPLGFLAALGVLDVLDRSGVDVRLSWTDELVPLAVIHGVATLDEVVSAVLADRDRWRTSPVLEWPAGGPLPDAKPTPGQLAEWSRAVATVGSRADRDLWCALVAEGALDNNGAGKPTHLHFTAGQQRFLVMVRELRDGIDDEALREGLVGPWRYESTLPSLSWDLQAGRPYAVAATDPSKSKRRSNPGAEWLAFLALRFFPVALERERLVTSACQAAWKSSSFRWPLWSAPIGAHEIASLVVHPDVAGERSTSMARPMAPAGISAVLEAPIRRSDQGGYGSFGAPVVRSPDR